MASSLGDRIHRVAFVLQHMQLVSQRDIIFNAALEFHSVASSILIWFASRQIRATFLCQTELLPSHYGSCYDPFLMSPKAVFYDSVLLR